MEENGNGFGPLGICHRLFNFIMSGFLIRGTKRIALGPNKEALSDHVVGADGNEILVEFRHTNGSMVNRTNNTSGEVLVHENENSTKPPQKNGLQELVNGNGGRERDTKKLAVTSGQVVVQNSTQTHQKKGSQDVVNNNGGREGVKKKTTFTSGQVLVEGNTNTTQRNNNGEREKETKRSTLTIVDGGNLPGRKHHLLNVTSNINEKADEFIRSRKEAMEKALSMKQNTDVY